MCADATSGDARRPDAVSFGGFATGLGLLLLVRFGFVLVGQDSFVLRDFSVFGYPLAAYLHDAFWAGELPLWNPYNHCGVPHLAQWNTLVCYPFSLIYCLLPVSWALNFFCLLHLYAGGLGMFVLARRWTRLGSAGALAGVGYAFSGIVINSLMWPNNSAAFGCLPWVIWAVERAGREGGRWVVGAAGLGALQMLTGAPEVILCTWVIIGCCRFADIRGSGWDGLRIEAGRVFGVVALIAGLSAIQLLPFFELLGSSTRATEGGDAAWSAPWHFWANYLCPLFRTTTTADGTLFLEGQAWTHSHYSGAVVLVLSLMVSLAGRERRVWCLAILTVLSAVLSLGEKGWLYELVKQFGPLGQMRYPVKLLIIPTVSLPLLAAFGLKRILESGTRVVPRNWMLVWSLVVFGFGLLAWLIARSDPTGGLAWGSWAKGLIAALLTMGLLVWSIRRQWAMSHLSIALLAIVTIDLWWHHPSLAPTVDRELWREQTKTGYEGQPPHWREGRIGITPGAQFVQLYRITDSLSDNLRIWRMTLLGNLNLVPRVPRVEGFYSLKLPRVFEVQKQLYTGLAAPRPAVADFLGVRQLLVDDGGLQWRRHETAMPLVTAGQSPFFIADEDVPRMLTAEDFDPRQHVLLPAELRTSFDEVEFTPAKVTNARIENLRVEFDVESEGPALAVIAQAHYPSWRATVNGSRSELLRANLAFQAVMLPPGRHHVVIQYEDLAFRWGTGITGISLLMCGWIWRRKKAAPDSEAA